MSPVWVTIVGAFAGQLLIAGIVWGTIRAQVSQLQSDMRDVKTVLGLTNGADKPGRFMPRGECEHYHEAWAKFMDDMDRRVSHLEERE